MNTGGLIETGELVKPPMKMVVRQDCTSRLISEHYLEVDYLLHRVEVAVTHYQTLGVDRAANSDQIIAAYHKAVRVLHPSYHKVRSAVPDEMLVRIDETFQKVSQAFLVLTNHKQRPAYDRSLQRRMPLPLPLPEIKLARDKGPSRSAGKAERNNPSKASENDKPESPAREAIETEVAPSQRPTGTRRASDNDRIDTRRCERFKLSVPVLVSGYESGNERWQEVGKTIDVSRLGVSLRLRKRLRHGAVVHVTLPLPIKLRSHGFAEAGYSMYAMVRRVEPIDDGIRVIGLEFLGANPPRGYLEKPWSTFRTQKWSAADRRREPRKERAERVAVEYLDEMMRTVSREVAVTENVSFSGARVRVKAAPAEFEFVRIVSSGRNFESVAVLRNRYTGADGVERICLQFVQSKWPIQT